MMNFNIHAEEINRDNDAFIYCITHDLLSLTELS